MRIESIGDVALVRLEAGKANAISGSFLDSLEALLGGLGDPGAVVLTGQGRAFSAGLDLVSLVGRDRAFLGAFIDRFAEVMLRVFQLPMPVIAAVNGHAIAGGCVLALQADLRLCAAGEARIGLNEAQLGIGLPAAVLETLRAQVPAASLPPIAMEGRLFTPSEALAAGLVHAVHPPEDLIPEAMEQAAALAALPRAGVRQVKAALRRPVVEAVRARAAAETQRWVDTWFSPAAQERLSAAASRLQRR